MAAAPPFTRLLDPVRLRYLDSPLPGRFDAADQAGIEALATLATQRI